MRGFALVILLAACGGGSSGPDVTVTTHFDVTQMSGLGPSPLDPLFNQTLDLEVVLDSVTPYFTDPAGCKSTTLVQPTATRTARGASADLVQREILDRLPDWDVRFEQCATAASTITAEAVIDELNLGFGCGTVPASALVHDAEGYPQVTSFTATDCTATILDVVNNRQLGATGFSITFVTGPDRVP